MQLLKLAELMHLTRIELCDFEARNNSALPETPEGSVERAHIIINLRNIRRVLYGGTLRRKRRKKAAHASHARLFRRMDIKKAEADRFLHP